MSDDIKPLLENAAKAMGYQVKGWINDRIVCFNRNLNNEFSGWNPLDNPADLAEMCAQLGIELFWYLESDAVRCTSDDYAVSSGLVYFSDHNNDRIKAWAMAALKVAAEIRKGK